MYAVVRCYVLLRLIQFVHVQISAYFVLVLLHMFDIGKMQIPVTYAGNVTLTLNDVDCIASVMFFHR